MVTTGRILTQYSCYHYKFIACWKVLNFPLEYFSFIKNYLKNYGFSDIYKSKSTKHNTLLEPNLLSFFKLIFNKFAGCMRVDFLRLKSFESICPKNVLPKSYFCKASFTGCFLLLLVASSIQARQDALKKTKRYLQRNLWKNNTWKKVTWLFLLFSSFYSVCWISF